MFCSKCGKENDDNAKFCKSCGVSLDESVSQNKDTKKIKFFVLLIVMVLIFFLVLVLILKSLKSNFENKQAMNTREDAIQEEMSVQGDEANEDRNNEAQKTDTVSMLPERLQVGDLITLGAYEQDGNTSNGPEQIQWRVINYDVNDSNYYLILSELILEYAPFDNGIADRTVDVGESISEETVATWEKSSIRRWLNNDFYNNAFSQDEKLHIDGSTLHTSGWEEYASEYPDEYGGSINYGGTIGGNDTVDNVFLLSVEELTAAYGVGKNLMGKFIIPQAISNASDHAINSGLNSYSIRNILGDEMGNYTEVFNERYAPYMEQRVIDNGYISGWYLRSGGCWNDGTTAMLIRADGSFCPDYEKKDCGGIRPAMWIKK